MSSVAPASSPRVGPLPESLPGRPALSLGLAFVLAILTFSGSGAPADLRSDEAAFLGTARSLVEDGDRQVERRDLRRLFDEAPQAGPLLLRVDAGDEDRSGVWAPRSPLYAVLLAPAVSLFGRAGAFGLNAVALIAVIALSGADLRRRTRSPLALPFAAGFVLLGACGPLVFRVQPACLFVLLLSLAVFLPIGRPLSSGLSGLSFALAGWAMPWTLPLALVRLPDLARGRKPALWWLAGAGAGLGIAGALALAFSTAASPPVWIEIANPLVAGGEGAIDWPTLLDGSTLDPSGSPLPSPGGLLFGAHAGWLPYNPLVGLAVLLWLLPSALARRPRAAAAGLAGAVGLLLLLGSRWPLPPGAWDHLGDPRFVPLSIAFLLLVRSLPGLWGLPASWAIGAAMVGPVLLTSLGSPVPGLPIHGHLGNPPWDRLPLEQRLLPRLAHWTSVSLPEGRLWYPRDRFSPSSDDLVLQGDRRAELWFEAETMPDNLVILVHGGLEAPAVLEVDHQSIELAAGSGPRRLEVQRLRPTREVGESSWLRIGTPGSPGGPQPLRVAVLGSWEFLSRPIYDLEWTGCGAPPELEPGEEALAMARLRNLSLYPWTVRGAARVRLSYRWLTENGEPIAGPAPRRTELDGAVPPGADLASWVKIVAPPDPGTFLLELDPVFEGVAWFSERNGGITCRVAVQVGRQ